MSNIDAFRKFLTDRKAAAWDRYKTAKEGWGERNTEHAIREKATEEELIEVIEAFDRYFPRVKRS